VKTGIPTVVSVFLLLLWQSAAWCAQEADEVLVVKSEKRLYLMSDGNVLQSFRVTFGSDPRGHKQQQGDGRTPEGRYTLDDKNSNSRFYKSIHISYPDAHDAEQARKRNVNPGGDIMIHGQPNKWGWASPVVQLFNWTDGCIALSDEDMDRVWDAVAAGTPIEIRP